jgi:hypothetical protein
MLQIVCEQRDRFRQSLKGKEQVRLAWYTCSFVSRSLFLLGLFVCLSFSLQHSSLLYTSSLQLSLFLSSLLVISLFSLLRSLFSALSLSLFLICLPSSCSFPSVLSSLLSLLSYCFFFLSRSSSSSVCWYPGSTLTQEQSGDPSTRHGRASAG